MVPPPRLPGECRRKPVEGSRRSELEQAPWIFDQDFAPGRLVRRPFPQQIPQLDRADLFGEGKMRALKILGVFYWTSRDGDDRGVKFPDSGDVRGAAGVVKVFKGHTQDRYWQRLRQFTAVLGVESEAVFHQLGLRSLAGAAKLAVHDGLHNHPGIVLSVVIEISKCTSQSVPFKLAFCRNAVATHPLR